MAKACSEVGQAIPFPGDLEGFWREKSRQTIENKGS